MVKSLPLDTFSQGPADHCKETVEGVEDEQDPVQDQMLCNEAT